MVRGTTAQFKFLLPYNFSDINAAKVMFWQPGNSGTTENPLPICKIKSQCCQGSNPKELSVILSQTETLRFSDRSKAYVQLSATTNEGERFASKQEIITVYPIYNDSPIGDLPVTPDSDGWIYLDGGTIAIE